MFSCWSVRGKRRTGEVKIVEKTEGIYVSRIDSIAEEYSILWGSGRWIKEVKEGRLFGFPRT